MKEELRTYILADVDVANVIGTRFFPEVAHQQDGSQPYAVYKTLNSDSVDTHSDSGVLYNDVIDISIHAPSITTVYSISDTLRGILSNKRLSLPPHNLYIKWVGFNTAYTDNDEIASGSITLEITWS